MKIRGLNSHDTVPLNRLGKLPGEIEICSPFCQQI